MSGFTLSYRDKWNNPVFRNLLEAGIWSWMCDAAAWKEAKVRYNGKLVTLKRGQLIVSERFISEGFCIGRQVTRTFLENLENEGMINQQPTHKGTIITICKYDKYQIETETANPHTNQQPTNSQPTANPNKNKGNKENKRESVRGTRLSPDWALPEEWAEWARKECSASEAQVLAVAESFKDHWLATTGEKSTKVDWQATWRNWCRREDWSRHKPKRSQQSCGAHIPGVGL